MSKEGAVLLSKLKMKKIVSKKGAVLPSKLILKKRVSERLKSRANEPSQASSTLTLRCIYIGIRSRFCTRVLP